MPFVQVVDGAPDTHRPMSTVRLEHLEARPWLLVLARVLWRQLDPIGYVLPSGTEYPGSLRRSADWTPPTSWSAPSHEPGGPDATGAPDSTDLASVPPFLWGVIASFGRHTLPALLHDRLCADAADQRATDPDEAARLRREADWLFRSGLKEQEVPGARRWVMWAAVRLFGAADDAFGKLAVVVALLGAVMTTAVSLPAIGHVVTGLSSWLTGGEGTLRQGLRAAADQLAPGAWTPWQQVVAVVLLITAAAAVAMGRRSVAGAVLVAAAAGPVVVPTLVVSLAATILLWLPSAVWWSVRKVLHLLGRLLPRVPAPDDPGPVPPLGPMNA